MKVKELEVEKAAKIEQVQRWMNCQDEESYVEEQFIFFLNIWLVSDVTWFDSLQTAVTASTENRKQAQEQNQEQQRNLINLQHDLSQVGTNSGYSTQK